MRIRSVMIVVCLLVTLATGASAAQPQVSIPSNITLQPVISGLTEPVFAAPAGDGSGRFFIVQQTGQILILKGTSLNAAPFLDVSSIIKTAGSEQGLLGLAFDPHYASNGYFYIVYTNQSTVGDDVLARYKVSSGNPDVADFSSAHILLTVSEPYENHNGGMLAFGPDGYLYFGLGDGGSGGDPGNRAQNTTTLLGKILRLDVSTVPYTIPPTNPFYNSPTAKKEIWAYGVRNPWRFSFDKSSGGLYIGDVGQNTQEEIDFQAAGSAGGQNYGWRVKEGNLCYDPASGCVPPPAYVAPVAVYNHGVNDSIGCAVTGGYVYRGSTFPALLGVYLYGDYCSGKLWGLYKNASNQWVTQLIQSTGYNISSFAQDERGELYLLDYGGQLVHITHAPIVTATYSSMPSLDGFIVETSESSGLGGRVNATSSLLWVGDTAANQQIRAILSFNTSSLPDNAVITSAKLRVKKHGTIGGDPFASLGPLVADVGKPVFSGNAVLQSSDFQAAAGYNRCARFSDLPVAAWYSAVMTPLSFSKINLTGNTQFRLRFTLDDNNNRASDRINFLSGNATTGRPQLIISYYVP